MERREEGGGRREKIGEKKEVNEGEEKREKRGKRRKCKNWCD